MLCVIQQTTFGGSKPECKSLIDKRKDVTYLCAFLSWDLLACLQQQKKDLVNKSKIDKFLGNS